MQPSRRWRAGGAESSAPSPPATLFPHRYKELKEAQKTKNELKATMTRAKEGSTFEERLAALGLKEPAADAEPASVPAPAPAAPAPAAAPAPTKSLFDAKEGNWGDDSDSDDAPRERAEPAFEEKPAAEPAEKPARWPRAQAPRKSPRAAPKAGAKPAKKTGAKPKPAPTNPAAATAPTKSVPQFKTAKPPRGKKKKSDPAFDRAGFERRGFGIFEG